jgi:cysteine-rich repeat protein
VTTPTPKCNDGKMVLNEVCDDGKLITDPTKGCLDDCSAAKLGYTCTGGTTTIPVNCVETCGDGYITHSEDCEDGGVAPLDGCNASCKFELGWVHTQTVVAGNNVTNADPKLNDGMVV